MFLCVTFRAPCVSPLVPNESVTSLEHTHPKSTSSLSSPSSRYSLSHGHKFMVFFRNRTALAVGTVIPTTYSVSDCIVAFTPAPTPCSRFSLSHAHKFMGFFRNRTALVSAATRPTTYSVSDNIVSFTLTPSPRSRYSLSHAHIIHTPTLPTSTLLTFTSGPLLITMS
jgi:hypothetical protein